MQVLENLKKEQPQEDKQQSNKNDTHECVRTDWESNNNQEAAYHAQSSSTGFEASAHCVSPLVQMSLCDDNNDELASAVLASVCSRQLNTVHEHAASHCVLSVVSAHGVLGAFFVSLFYTQEFFLPCSHVAPILTFFCSFDSGCLTLSCCQNAHSKLFGGIHLLQMSF